MKINLQFGTTLVYNDVILGTSYDGKKVGNEKWMPRPHGQKSIKNLKSTKIKIF